jgi:uncharacterized protein YecE (DUF72 family)
MHDIEWHIGCSGFHYKEWKEEFYPKGLPQRKWFDYYAEHFNTLELNVTFYRFPTLKMLQGWYEKAPEGFSFSAKVPRSITHYKRFNETETMMADFYSLLSEGLREKIACVLFQLPPTFSYDEEKLERILSQADPAFQNAIEFRNDTWWRGDVMERLAKESISFCGVSFPKIVHDQAVINAPVCYYRFHGVPKLFYSEYEPAFIERVAGEIMNDGKVKKAFVYFNNTASLAALHNAKTFKNLVEK